jgi:hypothetical protein
MIIFTNKRKYLLIIRVIEEISPLFHGCSLGRGDCKIVLEMKVLVRKCYGLSENEFCCIEGSS